MLPNAMPKYVLFFSAEKRHKQINIRADSNKPAPAIVSILLMFFIHFLHSIVLVDPDFI